MALDHGTLNVSLAKRGGINAQLDAHKKELAKLAKQETIESLRGILHLCKAGLPRVFANRAQAESAATRTGGEAYQSVKSARFLVRFPVAS
jgi:hypothetical protein